MPTRQQRAAGARVLDGPVVDVRPERVLAPAAEAGEPICGSLMQPSRSGRAQHLGGHAEGVDEVDRRAAGPCGTGR